MVTPCFQIPAVSTETHVSGTTFSGTNNGERNKNLIISFLLLASEIFSRPRITFHASMFRLCVVGEQLQLSQHALYALYGTPFEQG